MSSMFSFQGKVYLGDRDPVTGKLLKPLWMGDCNPLTLTMATESEEHVESFSGSRLPYDRLVGSKSATINMTLFEWLPQALALALHSQEITVAGASVTGEAMPTGLIAGDRVKLDHGLVSNLVITDSAGTPVTVPDDGTKYKIESANAGIIEWLDVAAYTQPFDAAYDYAAASAYALFSNPSPERYLLLDGVNTQNNKAVLARIFRVRFDPISELGLISDGFGSLPLSGSALYDEVNAADANMGGFGRFDQAA
jgi:hypothetical protein